LLFTAGRPFYKEETTADSAILGRKDVPWSLSSRKYQLLGSNFSPAPKNELRLVIVINLLQTTNYKLASELQMGNVIGKEKVHKQSFEVKNK